jgi:hypothetical protein
MVLQAINLGLLTLFFFIIGMIKPKWALFFMEKPTRWYVTALASVFFMLTMTLYGEGVQQAKMAKKKKQPVAPSSIPVPVPEAVPVPVPAAPKKK